MLLSFKALWKSASYLFPFILGPPPPSSKMETSSINHFEFVSFSLWIEIVNWAASGLNISASQPWKVVGHCKVKCCKMYRSMFQTSSHKSYRCRATCTWCSPQVEAKIFVGCPRLGRISRKRTLNEIKCSFRNPQMMKEAKKLPTIFDGNNSWQFYLSHS